MITIEGSTRKEMEVRFLIAQQLNMIRDHYSEITRACHDEKIPSNIVKKEQPKRDLEDLNKVLNEKGDELAINIGDIEKYFRLPIAH